MADEMRARGATVTVLGATRRLHLAAAYTLVRLLQTGGFDIVHLHVGGRLLQFLVRGCSRGAVVTHLHGPLDDDLAYLRGEKPLPHSILRRILWARPRRILTCSQQIAHMLTTASPQLSARVRVLPHGIDISRFTPVLPGSGRAVAARGELGFGADDFVVGFVGRLVPQKGIDHLVAIAQQLAADLPKFRLLVMGTGPLAESLISLEKRLGGGRIALLGERIDVEHWLPACDVFVLTSRWEAFGIVLLEAMASARPVVAFAVDGVPEVVADGESGLLVTPGDVPGFVAAVKKLADDPALCRQIGGKGRAIVAQCFTREQMASSLEKEYRAAMGGDAI